MLKSTAAYRKQSIDKARTKVLAKLAAAILLWVAFIAVFTYCMMIGMP